jgi:lipopolysaccharide/colanic/teichoic acid biosynthesis glycosyltransferase
VYRLNSSSAALSSPARHRARRSADGSSRGVDTLAAPHPCTAGTARVDESISFTNLSSKFPIARLQAMGRPSMRPRSIGRMTIRPPVWGRADDFGHSFRSFDFLVPVVAPNPDDSSGQQPDGESAPMSIATCTPYNPGHRANPLTERRRSRMAVSTRARGLRDPSGEIIGTLGRPAGGRRCESIDASPLASHPLRRNDWCSTDGPSSLAKRAIDLAGALTGLLLLSPVMLVLALLIRLESPGPVLFRQWRHGRFGRPFRMLKFRTMVVDAERRLGDLEHRNESAGGVLFKLRDDPRVTRLGRLLRRSSLDELPQLINVLRGEMSLVGPRPLQLRDCDQLAVVDPRSYARRLEVLPGLTGPWQIDGRSALDYERMVELDCDYVARRSTGWDLAILARTVLVVLLGRGAH